MYRVGWKVRSNVKLPETDPQEGYGDFVYTSPQDAWSFVDQYYLSILGNPYEYWVEAQDGHRYGREDKPVSPYAGASKCIKQVEEFHRAFGLPINESPELGTTKQADLLALRKRLITEEYNELMEAIDTVASLNADGAYEARIWWANVMKEAEDLRYVLYGLGIAFGMDLDAGFDLVHKSNMSKLVDGKPLMREDGKVLKGPDYVPADLSKLI